MQFRSIFLSSRPSTFLNLSEREMLLLLLWQPYLSHTHFRKLMWRPLDGISDVINLISDVISLILSSSSQYSDSYSFAIQ